MKRLFGGEFSGRSVLHAFVQLLRMYSYIYESFMIEAHYLQQFYQVKTSSLGRSHFISFYGTDIEQLRRKRQQSKTQKVPARSQFVFDKMGKRTEDCALEDRVHFRSYLQTHLCY